MTAPHDKTLEELVALGVAALAMGDAGESAVRQVLTPAYLELTKSRLERDAYRRFLAPPGRLDVAELRERWRGTITPFEALDDVAALTVELVATRAELAQARQLLEVDADDVDRLAHQLLDARAELKYAQDLTDAAGRIAVSLKAERDEARTLIATHLDPGARHL